MLQHITYLATLVILPEKIIPSKIIMCIHQAELKETILSENEQIKNAIKLETSQPTKNAFSFFPVSNVH